MSDLHVTPINDLKDHILSADCWCKPKCDEGILVHNSMDRREEHEEGIKLQ